MTMLYDLWHYKIAADDEDFIDDECDPKLIGIYSSREKAEAAIAQLRDKPGFRDWLGGFRIGQSRLDQTYWEEGFINPMDDPGWPQTEEEARAQGRAAREALERQGATDQGDAQPLPKSRG